MVSGFRKAAGSRLKGGLLFEELFETYLIFFNLNFNSRFLQEKSHQTMADVEAYLKYELSCAENRVSSLKTLLAGGKLSAPSGGAEVNGEGEENNDKEGGKKKRKRREGKTFNGYQEFIKGELRGGVS